MAEHKAQQEPKTCATSGCSFYGNPVKSGYCSKCFDLKEKEKNAANPSSMMGIVPTPTPPKAEEKKRVVEDSKEESVEETSSTSGMASKTEKKEKKKKSKKKKKNRCAVCKRKVGLTGIKCRCDLMFCSKHRYPSNHDCTFDYQADQRKLLAKNNPLVNFKKVDKL